MELTEILNSWKTHNEKVDLSIKLNTKLLEQSIHQKAEKALRPLIRLKTVGIIVTTIYLIILAYALYFTIVTYDSSKSYFLVSVSAIFLVNLKAIVDYTLHLYKAKKISFNASVIKVQEELTELQLSIINHAKTMCLQFPFFTTFYLSNKWFPGEIGISYMLFQILLTGSFIFGTYWLYKAHTIENINKKWFRNLIAGSGGKSVLTALDFYKELEEFKK